MRGGMVGTSIFPTGIWAVGMCAVLGQETELLRTGSTRDAPSTGCVHPCLFGLPPCPLLAFDVVEGGSGLEAAVDAETGRDVVPAVGFGASPSGRGLGEESFGTESSHSDGEVVFTQAECSCQHAGWLRILGGACVHVAGQEAEAGGVGEGVVGCRGGAEQEAVQEEGSLGGAGPCGARVRL